MIEILAKKIIEWKPFFDAAISILTIIGSLSGGVYALYKYTENSAADRAKETLVFVQRFGLDSLSISKNSIFKATEDILDNNEIIDKKDKKILVNENKLASEIIKILENKKLDLNNVFDFYDQLYICVLSKLCDDEIAKRFFGRYAYNVVSYAMYYINFEREEGDNKYAFGIEYFFNEYKIMMRKSR